MTPPNPSRDVHQHKVRRRPGQQWSQPRATATAWASSPSSRRPQFTSLSTNRCDSTRDEEHPRHSPGSFSSPSSMPNSSASARAPPPPPPAVLARSSCARLSPLMCRCPGDSTDCRFRYERRLRVERVEGERSRSSMTDVRQGRRRSVGREPGWEGGRCSWGMGDG